ncbi:zinc-ribbon domain-containing protein [Fictibacillus nanhaiensis]|uniref:zinc-ribbon domain-containing protein n=1 Tax=Fictibacillus nanhaiensis TaxID=742169 RepID=UPI002E21DEDB|nr:zinc-ribbon domain-containing protein [Fictibacillus nanhaiensis]
MNSKPLISEKLLLQWHPTKNKGIESHQTTYGSYEYIWWICSRGHEWGATIRERYKKNLDCSECLREERALKRGNRTGDFQTTYLSEVDPELALQWHPTLNLKNTTDKIDAYEDWPKRWWMCNRGHEWEETVKNRVHNLKNVCVYCSDKKANEDNCLATIHPELSKEWFTSVNKKSASEVVHNSNEEATWRCEKGHIWSERVRQRVKNQSKCPECTKFYNSLYNLYPEISNEWHPTRNTFLFSERSNTPKEVSVTSFNNVWWLCEKCGEEYTARVRDRVNGLGCKVCLKGNYR